MKLLFVIALPILLFRPLNAADLRTEIQAKFIKILAKLGITVDPGTQWTGPPRRPRH